MRRSFVIAAIKEIRQPVIKSPPGMGVSNRPRKVTRTPVRRLGPRILHRYADPKLGLDFCTAWPTFVTPTTSLSEQMVYAALAIFFGDPKKWWLPPYTGGIYWKYQTNVGGGRLFKGGQVCDFEITYGGQKMCLRLQSSRWHVMAEHTKQVMDLFLKTNTPDILIRDIFEEQFVGDCSGRTVVALVARTLTIGENASPLMFGTGRQVRR